MGTINFDFDTFSDIVHSFTSDEDLWDYVHTFKDEMGWVALGYVYKPAPGTYKWDKIGYAHRGEDVTSDKRDDIIDEFGISLVWPNVTEPIPLARWFELFGNKGHKDFEKAVELSQGFVENTWTIPVYSSKGRSGFVSYTMKKAGRPEKLHAMHWITQQAHTAYCNIRDLDSQGDNYLTPREIEILHWVAKGKSNSEIGELLGISAHTVNGYLKKIYIKTNTTDRVSASVRAIADGLVS